MTNEQTLIEAGLTQSEIDDMSAVGSEINKYQNVNAIDELAQYYLDAGMDDDALRVLDLKDAAVYYMVNTVSDATGFDVKYNDSVSQWYITGNDINPSNMRGEFLGKLSFDRNLSNDEYKQAIIDQLGKNPDA